MSKGDIVGTQKFEVVGKLTEGALVLRWLADITAEQVLLEVAVVSMGDIVVDREEVVAVIIDVIEEAWLAV